MIGTLPILTRLIIKVKRVVTIKIMAEVVNEYNCPAIKKTTMGKNSLKIWMYAPRDIEDTNECTTIKAYSVKKILDVLASSNPTL